MKMMMMIIIISIRLLFNLCLSLSCFYSAFSERINLVIRMLGL